MLGLIFQKYMNIAAMLGEPQKQQTLQSASRDSHSSHIAAGKSMAELDKLATEAGNAYRGAGVTVGLLGVMIVFCAIAQSGLAIENHAALVAFGVAKVSLMIVMLMLVYFAGNDNGLKEKWIVARHRAETLRYEALRSLKEELARDPGSELAIKTRNQLQLVLESPENGQISYNLQRATKYTAIEVFANRVTWIGFLIALICAALVLASDFHWISEYPELLFGTAFVPALVAGIHGINGFLNIGAQSEEHAKMHAFLEGLRVELATIGKDDPNAVLLIAERAYAKLVDRDEHWVDSTKKVDVKPA